MGERVAALGEVLRFDTSLDRAVVELATIIVAARWRSAFEWVVHSRLAARAGVAAPVIDAIGRGDGPQLDGETERAVHRLVVELLDDGQVSDPTFEAATRVLGSGGVVELVALVGYYCLISFVLNTFRCPAPAGETLPWADA